jgi:uncharacterized membrane protein
MEGLIILLVLLVIWVIIGPIVAVVKAANAAREAAAACEQLRALQERFVLLERGMMRGRRGTDLPEPEPVDAPAAAEEEELAGIPESLTEREARAEAADAIPPPPPPPLPPPLLRPVARVTFATEDGEAGQVPLPGQVEEREVPPQEPQEEFSLERFMGVKMFAWLGGVAMFFGVIFFVKYAFENNLIPPAVRIALGFVTGTGLLAGGLVTHRHARYRVLAQAFCATGVLILYGVTFAAHAVYHFPAFGPGFTFGLMGLITFVAFLVAVRLDALVVAVLGMLGGFLTPVLVHTGRDNVFGLFGYIALLDIGLLAASRHGRWRFLTSAAAAGTVLMQIGWYGEFFTRGRYFEDPKTLIPMGIAVFFMAMFLAGVWLNQRRREMDEYCAGAVLGLAGAAMLFAFAMLGFEQVTGRYFQLYGFVLLVQIAVIAVVAARPQWGAAQVVAAGLAFLHLALWSMAYLTVENLTGALALYLIFGALHAVVPVVLARRVSDSPAVLPLQAGPWFAPLVLLMMLLPLFHLSPVPMVIWAAILMADLLVIVLAVATGAVIPVLVSLVLTMGVAALWLLRVPAQVASLMPFLWVVTGFAAVFAVAGRWLHRGKPADGEEPSPEMPVAAMLPVCSGLLPFGLLILALLQLPVANPSPVFGVALLMAVLLSGMAVFGKQGLLVLAALIATLAVEAVWHAHHFRVEAPLVGLSWYLGFYALFLVFPFVFRKACTGQAAPWIASALSGVGHFLLVHDLVKRAWPNEMMGLVPLAFSVPAIIALLAVIRAVPGMDSNNRSQMAWFGGVALLFITLVFPIQFDRQWLTVSWAMEGALLLWLFRRVPHPGLQLTGLALLVISFVRLTFNPAVFADYPRSGSAILNWHLYAYGVVAVAQFLGARWFTDPAGRLEEFKPRGVLFALGGVLLFLLLNIEIADYFTHPDERCVAFRFGGNFPRDMTYSIAWGLFALGLLGIGIWKESKHARFAAIGLLVVTLLKVFLFDMHEIENIFRIGALVGVAVIAFIASFLYQRFFDQAKPS